MLSPDRQRLYGSCFVAGDHPELLRAAGDLAVREMLAASPFTRATRDAIMAATAENIDRLRARADALGLTHRDI